MEIFISLVIIVVLFALLWLVHHLNRIGDQMGQLGSKIDSLITLLERIQQNTEDTSKYLCEESQAYSDWKHELEVEQAEPVEERV